MANPNVTVNIGANTSQLEQQLNNIGRNLNYSNGRYTWAENQALQTSADGNTTSPVNNRMSEDIRREITQRGVMMVPGSSNFNQLMNAVVSQHRNAEFTNIEKKYDDRRVALDSRLALEEKAVRDGIEAKRDRALAQASPNFHNTINANFDKQLQKELDKLDRIRERGVAGIVDAEKFEKSQVEEDLVKIANELVQELKRGNPNSYLSRIREQQREAIWRRDNAETEEEVKDANRDLQRANKRMARAQGQRSTSSDILGMWSGIGGVINTADKLVSAYYQNQSSGISELNAAANGDIFSAMQQDMDRRRRNWSAIGTGIGAGVGAVLGAWGGNPFLGMGIGSAAGTTVGNVAFNWINGQQQVAIDAGKMWNDQQNRLQQYTNLALITSRLTGNTLGDERTGLVDVLRGGNVGAYTEGINFNDLGYTGAQYSNIVANRIKQRGFINNYSTGSINGEGKYFGPEVYRSFADAIALEKIYNMSEGSLGQLSTYDRYTAINGQMRNNANQDMANLVASLSGMGTVGMSGGKTLRANEFLNYQTQLMEMQKGWMDAPSSDYATRMLLAGQRAFGNNFDSRAISEIGQIENAITNPKEDYSKAILYDVIQNEFSDTRGNLLAIKQKQFSDDPEERARLNKAMFNRLTEVYGGVDTTSGYLALSHYTGIQDPNRLRKWVEGIQSGIPEVTQGNIEDDTKALKELLPQLTKDLLKNQDENVKLITEKLGNFGNLANKLIGDFNRTLGEIADGLKKL